MGRRLDRASRGCAAATPLGTSGLDFVCERVPEKARWYLPWRYGLWRATNPGPEPEGSLLEGIDRAAEG